MQKLIGGLHLCFLSTFCFLSCEIQDHVKPGDLIYKAIDSLNTTKQYFFDVPLDRTNKPDLIYRESMDADSFLGISHVSPGKADLLLHIGADFDGTNTRQYLILELQQYQWKGYFLKISKADSKSPLPYKRTIRPVKPRHGWRRLTDSLLGLNLLFIPTMDKLKDLDLAVAHSDLNCFHIQTRQSRRYFYYYGEETLKGVNNVHCKNTSAIIHLLRSEFF